ncbi:MAG: glycoside hydrolase family 31 protein [Muribaculaceae bacterium]
MKESMIYTIKNSIKAFAFVSLIISCSLSTWASQLGAVKSFSNDDGKVTVKSEKGSLIITPFTEDIIKVTTLPIGINVSEIKQSKSVVLSPKDQNFNTNSLNSDVVITIGGTKVIVNGSNSIITFESAGKIKLQESGGIMNGGKEKTVSFVSRGDESFYGTGERGNSLDLKGDTLIMYNKQRYGYVKGEGAKQMNITVPFFISSLGYGILFDDYAASKLILQNPIEYITSSKTPISYYYINSKNGSLAQVVANYTLLTGHQELAPFWSLGYITSKYGYKTEEETRNVIDTLRKNGYPVDGIVLDLYWYGKETDMGRFDWNAEQWPTYKKMLADLKADGVKLITISQPYLNKIGAIDNYNMAKKAGMLAKDSLGNVHDVNTWVGEAGMLDVSNKNTQNWMWSRYKQFIEDGVSGMWGDLGEPEVHPLTMRHANGETASEYHNQYRNDWSQIIYDGYKKDFPDTRIMTLMRGGTAGLQRFSVFPWSTDVSRSWGGLQAQVPIMLNTALSGMGYMSHDVGGFAVDKANPTDDELYARWLQLGLFTPILRTHSTVDAEPYHYNKPGYQNLFRNIIKTRYQWLPYNYTLSYENAISGAPFARPLNFNDATNSKLKDVEDQYMWGGEVLIAPVLEKDAIDRDIIIPEGKWIDMHMPQHSYMGPTTISYAAPIPVLPVFVKAGAFIPMAMYEMRSTEAYDPSRYTVKYYPSGTKSSYTMFDDDRTSTRSIADKQYQLITFEGDDSAQSTVITLSAKGKYAKMPTSREITFEIPACYSSPQEVRLNGKRMKAATSIHSIATDGYYYDPQTDTLSIKTTWSYLPTKIKITK